MKDARPGDDVFLARMTAVDQLLVHRGRNVFAEERSHFVAKCVFFLSEIEIHGGPPEFLVQKR
jgi:hypothetical protein